MGSLRVVAVENQTKRELYRWERVGQQPEEWLIGGLPLPNIRSAFYLDIIVEHDYGFRGDVAVDDLEFVNCSPGLYCSQSVNYFIPRFRYFPCAVPKAFDAMQRNERLRCPQSSVRLYRRLSRRRRRECNRML